jgi:hypothetical protein
MTDEQQEAQKANADRLRAQIEAIRGSEEEQKLQQDQEAAKPTPSPREFIQRRMREIEEQNKK